MDRKVKRIKLNNTIQFLLNNGLRTRLCEKVIPETV